MVDNVFQQAIHLRPAHVLVSHLAATMENHRLDLVPLAQKPDDLVLPDLIIVLGGRRPEFHFLDLGGFLMLALLVGFLVLLVEEFSVVHELANGRDGRRRDFHDIQARIPRRLHRVEKCHHPELVTLFVNHSDFARPDALVNPQTAATLCDKATSETCQIPFTSLQQASGSDGAKSIACLRRRAIKRLLLGHLRDTATPPQLLRRRCVFDPFGAFHDENEVFRCLEIGERIALGAQGNKIC